MPSGDVLQLLIASGQNLSSVIVLLEISFGLSSSLSSKSLLSYCSQSVVPSNILVVVLISNLAWGFPLLVLTSGLGVVV